MRFIFTLMIKHGKFLIEPNYCPKNAQKSNPFKLVLPEPKGVKFWKEQ